MKQDDSQTRCGETADTAAPEAGIASGTAPRAATAPGAAENVPVLTDTAAGNDRDAAIDAEIKGPTDLELAMRPMRWEFDFATARLAAELMEWPRGCRKRRCRRIDACAGKLRLRRVVWRDAFTEDIALLACAARAPDDGFHAFYETWEECRIRCWRQAAADGLEGLLVPEDPDGAPLTCPSQGTTSG